MDLAIFDSKGTEQARVEEKESQRDNREEVEEQRNVFRPFAQRRNGQWKIVDTIEEIFADRPFGLPNIEVSRRPA